MAAYAAVLSVIYIIEQIERHPRPPIYLDRLQIQPLIEKLCFLQDFLEKYSCVDSKEVDALESRIADAAYAAEDIIESHIVDQIQDASTTTHGDINSIDDLYKDLDKVIQDMDLIKRDVTVIKEKMGIQRQGNYSMSAGASRSSPMAGQKTTMVGFDDVLIEIMDKLTGQQSNLQIIPIVGMGGMGKTTLARNVHVNPLIVQYFDILVWVTISQEYSVKEILLESLHCQKNKWSKEELSRKSDHELGELLYKSLSGRRYLIIMDDLWSVEALNNIKIFFPDNNNGSRILITTRLTNLAVQVMDTYNVLKMKFLDEDNSWNLFCTSAFGDEDCPLELEEIGKKIAKSCKGLPLSITVIGGLLSKHKQSLEYWEYILENLNPILNSDNNEHCLKILRMSYKELSVHLKPCFIYMGIFPEDHMIRISRLIRLWVAEGFLKPISGKSLEMVAEEYLQDLVDRNLILVHKLGSTGKIKYCIIHDLLRDLCLKEAQKDNFLLFYTRADAKIPRGIKSLRRFGFHQDTRYYPFIGTLQSASYARSLICVFGYEISYFRCRSFRLLRVLMASDNIIYVEVSHSPKHIFQLVNSRFLDVVFHKIEEIPSSVHHLWNIQTLVVRSRDSSGISVPIEIWKMAQLRHVEIPELKLPDPPVDDFTVLENLQTLGTLTDFKFSEEVVKRIPNIKKLRLHYDYNVKLSHAYYLNNLLRLHKLESLFCDFRSSSEANCSYLVLNLSFPHSLKKLSLYLTRLHWEDLATMIYSLPRLQVLKLKSDSFVGRVWETFEGQFCSLKFLLLDACHNLQHWKTDSTHFPRLQHLVLRYFYKLREIPLEIGDITTLQCIELFHCSESAVISAREILEEQQGLGNFGLRVVVHGDRNIGRELFQEATNAW